MGYENQDWEGLAKTVTPPDKKDQVPVPKSVEGLKAHLKMKKDKEIIPDTWVVYMRICNREDGNFHWNPVRVQIEVDFHDEAR